MTDENAARTLQLWSEAPNPAFLSWRITTMSQPDHLQDELAKLTGEIDKAEDRARHRKEEGVGGLFPQEDESKADLNPNSTSRP